MTKLLLVAGASLAFALAAVANLPADLRAALKRPADFQTRTTILAIPNSVRTVFAKAAKQDAFAMAEPGAEWQATDVIMKQDLPVRRLEKVALSTRFCVIFYQLGGFASSYRVAVFSLEKDSAKLVWFATASPAVTDLPSLSSAIEKGQVDDTVKYL